MREENRGEEVERGVERGNVRKELRKEGGLRVIKSFFSSEEEEGGKRRRGKRDENTPSGSFADGWEVGNI